MAPSEHRHISSGEQGETPLVSVIMPVYNSKAYVEAALQSILDQDFESFEVIAVDDGSTDDSGKICDEVSARDGRVRVIHKQNGGISSARNAGLDHARGKYLMFCDNDDVVLPGFIRDNYALAERYGADMVRFGRIYAHLDDNGEVMEASELSPKEERVFREDEVLRNFDVFLALSFTVWTALYKRDLIDSHRIRFDEELRSGVEDHVFNDHAYRYAKCVVTNPHAYYEWRRRRGHSTSLGYGENTILGFKKSFELQNRLIHEARIRVAESEGYAGHMMFPLADMIRSRALGGKRSYLRERRTYKLFHDLYAPYYDELRTMKLGVRERRSLWLLERKLYLLFYLYGYFTDRRVRANANVQ